MRTQAKLNQTRKSSNGFKKTVENSSDHKNNAALGMTILNLNDDYTNHNCCIAVQYLVEGAPGDNIILVIDKSTGRLAEIMPNESGFIPWDVYEESQQLKQVESKDIAIGGMKLEPYDNASSFAVLSTLADFMPMSSSKQVLSIISPGASNGVKWIVLGDESGNIRCCLHPDSISYVSKRCS